MPGYSMQSIWCIQYTCAVIKSWHMTGGKPKEADILQMYIITFHTLLEAWVLSHCQSSTAFVCSIIKVTTNKFILKHSWKIIINGNSGLLQMEDLDHLTWITNMDVQVITIRKIVQYRISTWSQWHSMTRVREEGFYSVCKIRLIVFSKTLPFFPK